MRSPRTGEAVQPVRLGLRPPRQWLGAVVGSGHGVGLPRNRLGLRAGRRLTLRSSGASTACHQRPQGGTLDLFASRALAARRCAPLSSHVRHHGATLRYSTKVSALRRELKQPQRGNAASISRRLRETANTERGLRVVPNDCHDRSGFALVALRPPKRRASSASRSAAAA